MFLLDGYVSINLTAPVRRVQFAPWPGRTRLTFYAEGAETV